MRNGIIRYFDIAIYISSKINCSDNILLCFSLCSLRIKMFVHNLIFTMHH